MGYLIKLAPAQHRRAQTVARALARATAPSRFVVQSRVEGEGAIRLDPIRLFEPKAYCGSHPGPCPVRPGFERPHRRSRYLEGLDWVAVNDFVNAILDRLEVDAKVGSPVCVTRKGRRRRTVYEQYVACAASAYGPAIVDWVRVAPDGQYVDWCGRKAHPSLYPPGTPGYAGHTRSGQRRYAKQLAGH